MNQKFSQRQTQPKLRSSLVLLLSGCLLACYTLTGCHGISHEELHYLGDADLEHYEDKMLDISYPDICVTTPEEVTFSEAPRTLKDRHEDEIWDLKLNEAVHTALMNSRVVRTSVGQSPNNQLLSNPDFAPTVYDPAIQSSGVLFGGRSVEAALSDFDTTFTTSMVWGRNESITNNAFFGGGIAPGSELINETGNFFAGLRKQFAHGGTLELNHVMNYLGSNVPGQLFPSSYTGFISAEYRHPLWAGSGTEYTRIAGPTAPGLGAITGVSQGVVIARINEDISVADFELQVRNLLLQVEQQYWSLYLQYRRYETIVSARNSALRTWREAKAKLDIGGIANFKPADEAQARDQYFQARALAERALSDLFIAEQNLRNLCGLPVNDGRIIRPVDEPITASFEPEWHTSLAEALTKRVELRRQKWNIKSFELQLYAAESLTAPRLDFVSSYQVNAFGDKLFAYNDDDGITTQGLRSAYETVTQGNQTGWNLGFELSIPIGFRSAQAQVRNYELRVAKAREVLAAQELDISHELARSLQSLAAEYQTAQSNLNRMIAARRRVRLFEAELEAGTTTLDLVLRAQSSLADAEVEYYTSLVQYNQQLAQFQLVKGSLLENYNVQLSEGGWNPEAYQDALHKAWARSHAFNAKGLHTEPCEFAVPYSPGQVELVRDPSSVEQYDENGNQLPPPAPSAESELEEKLIKKKEPTAVPESKPVPKPEPAPKPEAEPEIEEFDPNKVLPPSKPTGKKSAELLKVPEVR